jgi:hypothetical protein
VNQHDRYPSLTPAQRGGNIIRTLAILVCIMIMILCGIIAAVVVAR